MFKATLINQIKYRGVVSKKKKALTIYLGLKNLHYSNVILILHNA